jgi:RNA polymerase sigma-70 factor (ECF subfamily)
MKESQVTDIELVRCCLDGNRESFRTLMDRYRAPAMALALNILTNPQDAEDACQEGFLRAYKNMHTFDIERNFKNWFYGLLSNACLDQLRKRKRFSLFVGRFRREFVSAVERQPAAPAATGEFDFKYLRCLSPKERASLYLWSQEECSGEEIAAVLGCSRKTAYVHLFRARTKLKAALKEERHGTL